MALTVGNESQFPACFFENIAMHGGTNRSSLQHRKTIKDTPTGGHEKVEPYSTPTKGTLREHPYLERSVLETLYTNAELHLLNDFGSRLESVLQKRHASISTLIADLSRQPAYLQFALMQYLRGTASKDVTRAMLEKFPNSPIKTSIDFHNFISRDSSKLNTFSLRHSGLKVAELKEAFRKTEPGRTTGSLHEIVKNRLMSNKLGWTPLAFALKQIVESHNIKFSAFIQDFKRIDYRQQIALIEHLSGQPNIVTSKTLEDKGYVGEGVSPGRYDDWIYSETSLAAKLTQKYTGLTPTKLRAKIIAIQNP
jgi:hypothetical protein